MPKHFSHLIQVLWDLTICLNYNICYWFQFSLLLLEKKDYLNQLRIQWAYKKDYFFIIKYKHQIMTLHSLKYFPTHFHYGIPTGCVENKMYIWCSCGYLAEPHPSEEPHTCKSCQLLTKLSLQLQDIIVCFNLK